MKTQVCRSPVTIAETITLTSNLYSERRRDLCGLDNFI